MSFVAGIVNSAAPIRHKDLLAGFTVKGVETFLIETDVLWSESSQEIIVLAMNLPLMDNGGSVHPM